MKSVIQTSAIDRMLRMMETARDVSGKTTEQIVVKHTGELSKNLARRAGEIAKPVAYYDGLATTLGYRLRRPSDSQRGIFGSIKRTGKQFTSISKEIRSRKASRKYLASCWLRVRKISGGRLQTISKPRGEIRIVWPNGPFQKGSVTLINKARNKREGEMIASQVHAKYGIVGKAANDTTRNMIPYIRRKRGEAIEKVRKTP